MSFKNILRRRAKKQQTPSLLGKFSSDSIILRPLMTEKSLASLEQWTQKVYQFAVNPLATKIDISLAFSNLFGKKPDSIKTARYDTKWRARRKVVRRAFKKAYITLKKGESIELF